MNQTDTSAAATYYSDTNTDVNRYEFSEVFGKKINGENLYQSSYQLFLRNWMSMNTLNDSILLFHSLGTGKTCTAISIAEGYKEYLHDIGRKIIVMAPNDLLKDNFKGQLLSKCTGTEYVSKQDLETRYQKIEQTSTGAALRIEKDRIQKEASSKIDKYYHFTTYDTFVGDFNNSVVIIDEVHNIVGNNKYDKILKLLQESYNFRLILLTATPIVDTADQIIKISNLLNSDNIDNFITKTEEEEMLVNDLTDNYYNITEAGMDRLRVTLHGKISYINENVDNTPTKVYMGTNIEEIGGNAIKVQMSPYQKSVYDRVLSEGKQTARLDSVAIMTYPGGQTKFKEYTRSDDIFLPQNIREYSAKLYALITNLKTAAANNELSFVYTSYIENGVNLLKAVFKKNRMFKVQYITGSTGDKNVRTFNSEGNKNGTFINILVGTDAISEGITLKNVRHVHIIEPHWNVTKIDQVIGRAVRNGSHSMLPVTERNVNIYKYINTGSSSYDIDFEKYRVSFIKDKIHRQIYRLMKEASIDCVINKENYNKYIRTGGFQDGSQECDYQSCAYECKIAKKRINEAEIKTYNINIDFFDKFQLDEMKVKILDLFKIYFIWDLEYILAIIRKEYGSISDNAVYTTLNEIVTKKLPVRDMYNREGTIYAHGVYYIFKSNDKEYNDSFYSRTLDFTREPSNYFSLNLPTVKPKEKTKEVTPRIVQYESDITNEPIYAIHSSESGSFKIVINNAESVQDDRRVNTGRSIISITGDNLKKIATDFGLQFRANAVKTELAELIKKYMFDNNLVIRV